MRHERTGNSEGRVEGSEPERSVCVVVFKKVIKHFEDILFWARTVIRMTAMIKLRHEQPSLSHRGLAEDIEGLWEAWMRLADVLLEDDQLGATVNEAQGERHPQTLSPAPCQTP